MKDDRCPVALQRDDPGLGGQVEHANAVECTAGLYVHAADHERALPYREGSEYLQPHGGADEPRCGQVDGRTDVVEAEPAPDGLTQLAVVDPQHDGNPPAVRRLVGTDHLPQHEGRLDIDHVVLGQDRDGPGVLDVGGVQRGSQGGVAEDDRNPQFGRLLQVAVGLVAFDHRHRATGLLEQCGHPDAERTQTHDHVMAAQMADRLPARGAGQSPRDKHVGEEGDDDRGGRQTAEHHHHAPQPQPHRLIQEVEVAVADGGQRLGGEVQRIHPSHAGTAAGIGEGQPEDHGRTHQQRGQHRKRAVERRVDVLVECADGVDDPLTDGAATHRHIRGVDRAKAPRTEVVGLADHRGPVTALHRQVEGRAGDHVPGCRRALAAYHRHRRETAVDLAQRPVPRSRSAGDDELDTGDLDGVGGALQ